MKTKWILSTLLAAFAVVSVGIARSHAAVTYREPWRPQFHFTPATNWMNDPNGMVYYEGEYHLFYQYNPFGTKWGHMSWGHAVSKDLVHWEHLPIALYEENDVMIFSGSAVVDWNNTTGFGSKGKPPLVAIYTGHYTKKPLQNQHIAYSNDRGRTWTKYERNPVLDIGDKDFRDPKVMWHEPSKQWIMTVAWPTHRKVRFYSSPNLKDWQHLSDFGPAGSTTGIWECPDLFPLKTDGRKQKWVLVVNVGSGAPAGGSGCQYFVGDFNGKTFTLDESFPRPTLESVPEGKVLADFEGDDFGSWRATGAAFDKPVRGGHPNQQAVAGFRGRALANSFKGGDQSEGTLVSPDFEITHDHVSFLIGGGNHAGRTCMNLLIDNVVARTATGDADERLSWKSWDVREFRGRTGRIEIVDRHTGGWGHINVDHILLANQPARPATQPALWADFGRDFYAAVSWSDVPKSDGRRLWLGWMSNWEYANDVPTSPWRSAMSIPRELSLRTTPEGVRLLQKPVDELEKLYGKKHRLGRSSFAEAREWLGKRKFESELLDVEMELAAATDGIFALKVLNGPEAETVVRCDFRQQRLTVDRTRSGKVDFSSKFPGVHTAPLVVRDGSLGLRILLDTSSIEIFAGDGESVVTDLILPAVPGRRLELVAEGAEPRVRKIQVRELKSAWRSN